MEQQATYDWRGWLNGLLTQCHPIHAQIVAPLGISYYWSAAQSEYATDLMFSSTQSLTALYERVIRDGITHFSSENVLRFLGRRYVESYQGEVTSEIRERAQGVRIKHCRDANSIKLYDKAGQVLRVETTINDPKAFRVLRAKQGDQEGEKSWASLAQKRGRFTPASGSLPRSQRTLPSGACFDPDGKLAGRSACATLQACRS